MLVLHALTGDSHVAGPAGTGHPDRRLVGRAGRSRAARSTPTGGSSWRPTCSAAARARPARRPRRRTAGAWGSRFPFLTVRDQVEAEARLADRSASTAGRRCSAARWAACGRSSGRSPIPTGCRGRGAGLHGVRHGRADRLVRAAAARRSARPGLARRRLPRRPPGRAGPGSASRGGSRTSRTAASRAGAALRPLGAGRRAAAGRWRPVRRRELPRPPRRQAVAPVRRRAATWC